jgi:large subunit ribosomal protein L5
MRQRLKHFYHEQVTNLLCEKFRYRNIHQIPRLEKIVINRGLGEIAQNSKVLELSLSELTIIAGQCVVVTRARSSIAGFKIREKIPVGMKVTLRGRRMYAFLDRLINLALPRIRDFQGVSPKNFDGRGNYSLGLEEQLMFPEICYDQIDQFCGLDLSIVTTSDADEERIALLKSLGIPFLINFMTKDNLSETLTCIRNAIRIKSQNVEVPKTRITQSLSDILLKEGLIEEIVDYSIPHRVEKSRILLGLKYTGIQRVSVITDLQVISRPGLRIYVNHMEIPKIFGGLGLVILSTSKGLITDREARYQKLGGEVVCSIWLSLYLIFK